ncbi:heme exporter protein CcmD [Pseudoxanthomonas composti]|uniref:Heme exporter protein D n=1 Tax=Pseudoxanthomonas composti TaxID=2137479 RepID=A0A4Q1JWN2_9GAMM|nr:heme exporter protein CcmD [Pseudoxanthomonas composti]RXR07006.1 heme exporter protein CcmD [Pseudoxanthomonas composti]
MSYLPYVIGAYAVFVLVLAWDFIAPRLQLRRQLRAARALARRQQAARSPRDANAELAR